MRAHSKYSASGAERWEACPGSVQLSEGLPDKSSPWAEEGTKAHAALEKTLIRMTQFGGLHDKYRRELASEGYDSQMIELAIQAAKFILNSATGIIEVESRIHLPFIHPEMFGTYDAAAIDHFGTLNVFDYKYGAGHAVSTKDNLQMAFYGIGLAHKYDWNFKRVRMWIIQPRIKGYDGPTFWEVPIMELKTKWVDRFRRAVERVEAEPNTYVEGGHCHWCKAKAICPLKTDAKLEQAKLIFGGEELGKSEKDWRAKKGRAKKEKEDSDAGGEWI